jgi:hypothetical protein
MSNTADVTGDKLIAVWPQSISGVNAITPLVDTTRDIICDIDIKYAKVTFRFVANVSCCQINYGLSSSSKLIYVMTCVSSNLVFP